MSRQLLLTLAAAAAMLATAGSAAADYIWDPTAPGNEFYAERYMLNPTSMPDRATKRPPPCTAPDPGNIETMTSKAPLLDDIRKPSLFKTDKQQGAAGDPPRLGGFSSNTPNLGPGDGFHASGGGGSSAPGRPYERGDDPSGPIGPGPVQWPTAVDLAEFDAPWFPGLAPPMPKTPDTPIAPDHITVVPEPMTVSLLAIGGIAMLGQFIRRKRTRPQL